MKAINDVCHNNLKNVSTELSVCRIDVCAHSFGGWELNAYMWAKVVFHSRKICKKSICIKKKIGFKSKFYRIKGSEKANKFKSNVVLLECKKHAQTVRGKNKRFLRMCKCVHVGGVEQTNRHYRHDKNKYWICWLSLPSFLFRNEKHR